MGWLNPNKQTPRPDVRPPAQGLTVNQPRGGLPYARVITVPTDNGLEVTGTIRELEAAGALFFYTNDSYEPVAVQWNRGLIMLQQPPRRQAPLLAGRCWKCGDTLAEGARFCITCGVEQPPSRPATGPTTKLGGAQ